MIVCVPDGAAMADTMNIILATDSYKLTHWKMYPPGTEAVYSYFESRVGAEFSSTVFFGLQAIVKKYLQGQCVEEAQVAQARALAGAEFGSSAVFNEAGWRHVLTVHGGRLPLRIRAV